ncbi:ring-cleaving dioxygenase [Aurantimonas endophytica]|uniref:Glyoxalase family protein n=1 Tax=Aurantimonas endophytica TaxID=1522175 RepID=A0A7W6HBF0_9HYPH|nr:ring-cleaving dioxygenase [Aurantimonas endophytica]MBB4002022.1 glyoxalase family protein [Aurantimonas endophytica]MCO6402345.1 ring-cleaving dioxygenase [Aurantimonas endophytica]
MTTRGIHHVSIIAGTAARNVAFYTGVLGLRLVKKTVNFDDSGAYHLYYGDETGRPGSVITFFPWENVAPGRLGIGETQETAFRVPQGAIGYWTHRFVDKGVAHERLEKRFGETVLPFRDPDGTRLALVAVPGIEAEPAYADGGIPAENALRGLHSVSLLLEEVGPTGAILTDVLGFRQSASEGFLTRFDSGATLGGIVDIRAVGDFLKPRQGGGSVHHVAFRAADDAEEAAMVKRLAENHGITTTDQLDRNYFRSVYFREPGHVLFEIATDIPGFTVDEKLADLGSSLKLPAQFEPFRQRIEAALPAIDAPGRPAGSAFGAAAAVEDDSAPRD